MNFRAYNALTFLGKTFIITENLKQDQGNYAHDQIVNFRGDFDWSG